MNLSILNSVFDEVSIVDVYESFIWTDRYYSYGDFELFSDMRSDFVQYIKEDMYVQNADSEHVMIIESLLINSDIENGNRVLITGKSLESILDRRVIWGQKTVTGNLQDGIHTLINESIINPSNVDRKINNFIFKYSTNPTIAAMTINAQYTGDNLYLVIQKICEEKLIGFKITLNDNKELEFELYIGTDRSYDQNVVPYVEFSPNFDNIINSNYVESKSALKNVTLVGGEGEGSSRKFVSVGSGVGISRREMFTDARYVSSDVEGGVLTNVEYEKLLVQKGSEDLAVNSNVTSFEGQAETTIMYKYGEDFFMGDIIQTADEYGHETSARIVEIIQSQNDQGTSTYPTFKTIN